MMQMWPRVGCVVLAAGEGKRFGARGAKLLLPFHGSSLVQRAIDTAARSHASSCTLVVGAGAERILSSVDTRRCTVAVNARWKEGLASSIGVGLAEHANDDACIFAIADQPVVTDEDLNGLIRQFAQRRTSIVALRAGDVWGSPLLFPQMDFGALSRLRGDAGAKSYASNHRDRLKFQDASRPDALRDVDTAVDYERLTKG